MLRLHQPHPWIRQHSRTCGRRQPDEGIVQGMQQERRHGNPIYYPRRARTRIVIVRPRKAAVRTHHPSHRTPESTAHPAAHPFGMSPETVVPSADTAPTGHAKNAARIRGSTAHATHRRSRPNLSAAIPQLPLPVLPALPRPALPRPSAPGCRPYCSPPAPTAGSRVPPPSAILPQRRRSFRCGTASATAHPCRRSCACSYASRCTPRPTTCSRSPPHTANATIPPAHAPAPRLSPARTPPANGSGTAPG